MDSKQVVLCIRKTSLRTSQISRPFDGTFNSSTESVHSVLQAQQMEILKCRIFELLAAAAVDCMSLKKYKYIMYTNLALAHVVVSANLVTWVTQVKRE